jgi:hypothetical protein
MPIEELLTAIAMGYPSWTSQAFKRKLDTSSPEWETLCGHLTPAFVLQQFEAMQAALTELA